MSRPDLLNAFDDCIDCLGEGETLEACLQRYPEHAAELRPMLEAGLLTRRALPTTFEIEQAQERVRFRIAQAVPVRRSSSFRILPLVATLAGAFAVIIAVAAIGAETTLPGDTLYPFKRLTENIRLSINGDDALADQFNQRRIDEIRQLQVLRREANVDFRGDVQQIDGTDWNIAGLEIIVQADVPGSDSVLVGDEIAVEAQTTTLGTLAATQLELINSADFVVTPEVTDDTPTPAVTLTPESTPTSTVQPTPTLRVLPAQVDDLDDAEACIPIRPEGWIIYTIPPGETLSRLASVSGISLEELMEINCLDDPRLLVAGQQIYLPTEPPPPPSLPAIVPSNQPAITPSPTVETQANSPATSSTNNQSASSDNQGDDNDNGGDSSENRESGSEDEDNSGDKGEEEHEEEEEESSE